MFCYLLFLIRFCGDISGVDWSALEPELKLSLMHSDSLQVAERQTSCCRRLKLNVLYMAQIPLTTFSVDKLFQTNLATFPYQIPRSRRQSN